MSIESVKQWFVLAVPNPSDKNRAVQLGCHYEEVAEMAEATSDVEAASQLHVIADELKTGGTLEDIFGPGYEVDRKELTDSLADQIVTAIGIAHMFGIDIVGALAEVDRSNYSKFVDGKPMFNEHGKIAKGPDYTEPDLSSFY